MLRTWHALWGFGLLLAAASPFVDAEEAFSLQLRSLPASAAESTRTTRPAKWDAGKTAVIVCDVWDLHHCRNAVRRLEEFAPRLNQFLIAARRAGATIIHSPSDCMPAYADHPARLRAIQTPVTKPLPRDVEHWCSRIPAEEKAVYPIDQSDGGEDDDPAEHAEWAAHLKSLGRNPGMPWKSQLSRIEIDAERDFISDRGGEIWNILAQRGIRQVMLTGVHCNMCVLGRPFGLRQMARNGLDVVLVRDLTDSMYNPHRWPYVDHFTGHDLVIAHVERYVCPTITSDQLLGGEPFRWQADQRSQRDVASLPVDESSESFSRDWSVVSIPPEPTSALAGYLQRPRPVATWYRCALRIPARGVPAEGRILLRVPSAAGATSGWLNGHPLTAEQAGDETVLTLSAPHWVLDDANLLVLKVTTGSPAWSQAPVLVAGETRRTLQGRWQCRIGDDSTFATIPLPAKFGASPDVLFELE